MRNSFSDKVYEIAKRIPKGKVITYGQLAKLAGSHKAARAVGMAMKKNPDMTRIPCHRVVGREGNLTGYSGDGGISSKKEMLLGEGVFFKKDKVDLTRSLWNP